MTLAPPSQLDVHGAEEAIPLPPSEELIGTTPAEAEPDTNKGNNSFTPAALTGGTTVSLVELRAGMQRTVMVIGWEMRAPLEICLSKVSEFRKMFHGRYVCQIEPGEAIELPQAPAAPAAAGPKLCDDPPGFHVFHTDCM